MKLFKINYSTILLSVIIVALSSCSEDNELVNFKDNLVRNTWINYGYSVTGMTDGFEEYYYKDEYSFYENGTFVVTGLRNITVDEFPYSYIDTVELKGEWLFEENNSLIDFKTNDTVSFTMLSLSDTIFFSDTFISRISLLRDWKVEQMEKNEFIVKHVHPADFNIKLDYEYKEKLLKKIDVY